MIRGWLAGAGLILLAATPARAQVPEAARTKGSPTAPVTVYEMSDFQCPYCRQHAVEVFPLLEREFVRGGKVKWIFVNLPITQLHPNAVPAAEFAMCAAKHGKFWEAHDLLFKNQETWAPLKNPAPYLLAQIDALKLPKAPMTTCLQKAETRAQIQADAEGAEKSGARSTPTFYVEGGLMVGVKPPEFFKAVLDSIYLAKTRSAGSAKP
jgi:protein-disulfide isomerase